MNRRRTFLGALVAASLSPSISWGQAFPSKTITLVVPYPAGGPTDIVARALGEYLTESLKTAVIVDNRPGAGGQVAGSLLLRLPADGYTLFMGDGVTLGLNKAIYTNFSYDPLTDMQAIAPLLMMPMMLYVPGTSRFTTLADLVAASKQRPLNYASQGPGTLGHVLGETLKAETGGQFVHIPYKGAAPAMADLVGGQVDLLFDGLGAGLPYLSTDKLKALAVTTPQRLSQLPHVPTMSELGYRNVSGTVWMGVTAKAGTPLPVVQRLHDEISAAMKSPKILKRFADFGFQTLSMTTNEFSGFVKSEAEKSQAIAKARRISID